MHLSDVGYPLWYRYTYVGSQGYLIINREIVSEDVANFEYTPKAEYKGPFIVWNLEDEEAVIRKFFAHIREVGYRYSVSSGPVLVSTCVCVHW